MFDYGGDKKPSHGGGPTFAEIVGQDELKRGLLAVAANDDLDGLLIRGAKGTAKSTAVRALADLLPTQTAVADCQYGCPPDDPESQCADCRERTDPPTTERPVPLVTLPLGATRERVVGTLSVADALDGDYEFDPGLLARANRGILYVDEVNLLDDHLVDVLLDAAASGVNRVERDGVSVAHPAEFTLVGTMNPEEGDLRPQLRDRFALQATVTGREDIDERVAIIEQALGQDEDTDRDTSDDGRRRQLRTARERLPEVTLPDEFAAEIAELCRDAGVEGHRGDIATARAARTFAALDGRSTVIEPDVRDAASFALPHRLKSRPFEDTPDPDGLLDEHFDDDDAGGEGESESDADGDGVDSESEASDDAGDSEGGADEEPDPETDDEGTDGDSGYDEPGEPDEESGDGPKPRPSPEDGGSDSGESEAADAEQGSEDADGGDDESQHGDEGDETTEGTPLVPGQSRIAPGESAAPSLDVSDAVDTDQSDGDGRVRTEPAVEGKGARVRTRAADDERRIDAAASVRAASARGGGAVQSRDLRQSVREREGATLVTFVVDASASMRPAMRAAKGTVLELLKDAYQHRDEVAFVAFAGEDADVLVPPTDSTTLAARHLKDLPTGDRTPLPAGLRTATEVVERAEPAASVVVVVTDGRANVGDRPTEATRSAAQQLGAVSDEVLVVDAGEGGRAALTDVVIEATGGDGVPIADLRADTVDGVAGSARD